MAWKNRDVTKPPQVTRELKSDVFGRIELLEGEQGAVVRRVACGSKLPGSGWLARRLMARERRALGQLGGVEHVSGLLNSAEMLDYVQCASLDGHVPRAGHVLLRRWIPGCALQRAEELPRDFFERLEDLLFQVHQRGVCHNDLHKEPNVVVGADGQPALIDFQLASVHRTRGRTFNTRVSEDLRHADKHRRRYVRAMGGTLLGSGLARHRSALAKAWMRFGKPLYNRVTRRWMRYQDGEERRMPEGPWPVWCAPVGCPVASDTKLPSKAKPSLESTDSG